jgi:hypothetical protein
MRTGDRLRAMLHWLAPRILFAESDRASGSNPAADRWLGTGKGPHGSSVARPGRIEPPFDGFPGVTGALRTIDELPVRGSRPDAGSASAISLFGGDENLFVTRGEGDKLVLVSLGPRRQVPQSGPMMFIDRIPVLHNAETSGYSREAIREALARIEAAFEKHELDALVFTIAPAAFKGMATDLATRIADGEGYARAAASGYLTSVGTVRAKRMPNGGTKFIKVKSDHTFEGKMLSPWAGQWVDKLKTEIRGEILPVLVRMAAAIELLEFPRVPADPTKPITKNPLPTEVAAQLLSVSMGVAAPAGEAGPLLDVQKGLAALHEIIARSTKDGAFPFTDKDWRKLDEGWVAY